VKRRREIDMRQYASATQRRFVRWGIVLIVGGGLGLIGLLYGTGMLEFAGLVMLIMSVPVLLIIGTIWILGWIAKKADSD
jgi:hypothetical protein